MTRQAQMGKVRNDMGKTRTHVQKLSNGVEVRGVFDAAGSVYVSIPCGHGVTIPAKDRAALAAWLLGVEDIALEAAVRRLSG